MINSNFILILFVITNLIFLLNFSKIKIFHLNIDKPDKKRKFHSQPTPLAGGILIFINLILYWFICIIQNDFVDYEIFFQNQNSLNYFIGISTIIFILGFIDDKVNLKANLKFIILLIAILLLLLLDKSLIIDKINFSFFSGTFILDGFSIFFSVFCFLVFINAFNMFDGINLQSGLYSILIFFCILIFYSNSFLVKIMIISLICFSYLNFKNKTFLGDSGSLLISFIISYLFIKLYNLDYIKYAENITLYMMIPGLDLIRLFVLRTINKKNPLTSDRNHLHHILIKKYSFEKTLIIIFLLISLPLIMNNFNVNNLFTIFVTIFIYCFVILFSSKKTNISP